MTFDGTSWIRFRRADRSFWFREPEAFLPGGMVLLRGVVPRLIGRSNAMFWVIDGFCYSINGKRKNGGI